MFLDAFGCQCRALTAVASVAKSAEAKFGKYYDAFIPGIKAIVVATAPKAGTDPQVCCCRSTLIHMPCFTDADSVALRARKVSLYPKCVLLYTRTCFALPSGFFRLKGRCLVLLYLPHCCAFFRSTLLRCVVLLYRKLSRAAFQGVSCCFTVRCLVLLYRKVCCVALR